MNKAYNRINDGKGWKNYPSDETPLNEQNLNKQDIALDEIDNRVITLDNTKATKTEVSSLFSEVSYNEKTGIITFTRKNGAKVTIDTPMEKIALNIYYDPETEMLTLPLIDGTQMQVDLSRLITEYEFLDSDTIAFSVNSEGKVTAIIKEGSVEEKHLRPEYLSDIKIEESKAKESAVSASNSAKYAESYAHGETGTRPGEETDNAKYYKEQAQIYYENLEQSGHVTGVKGNSENRYRTGNVNLTPENIGSLSTSGGRMTGSIKMEGDAYITYYTPTAQGVGHARGIDYVNPDTLERWGGIGAIGTSGVLQAIYIGANNPNPWSSNVGLRITDSDITWKDSKMLTERSGNAVSASKLNTPRSIDGVNFDGSTDITHYGVCNTAGYSNHKIVTIPGFQLKEGARIIVNFLSENTATGTVTLNVNSTGQRVVVKYANGSNTAYIRKGLYEFIYAEGYWVLATGSIDYDIVDFISYDSVDSSATSWRDTSTISSNLSLRTILSRISGMIKNVRYLHNCLTKKGFLNKTLNISCSYQASGYIACVYNASTVMLHFSNFQNVPVASSIVIATLPSEITPRNNCTFERTTPGGCIYRLHIQTAGSILIYRYNNNDIYNVGMTITYLL